MGTTERRRRERAARRQAILDAARDLFVADGYEHVSIRRIAARIEYSPAAIYRYFSGKSDIFFALAEAGFREFDRAMKTVTPGADPLDTLTRLVWQYYRFSKAQPQYFALMFVDRSVPRISREWDRFAFARTMRNDTAEAVVRCIESGVFPPDTNPDAAFHILATAVHGAAVIRLGGRFCPRAATDALARDVIATAIAGLRQGVRTRFRAGRKFHSACAASRPALPSEPAPSPAPPVPSPAGDRVRRPAPL